MNITDVRVRKIKTEGKMKAVASITIEGSFVVHDIKIIEGNHGYFIAMPSRKVGEGEFKDVAHPINTQTRNQIQDMIFASYQETYDESLERLPEEGVLEASQEVEQPQSHEITIEPEEEIVFETEDLGSATTL